DDQFPPAGIDPADAGVGVRREGADVRRLRACGARALPLLQLRGCDAAVSGDSSMNGRGVSQREAWVAGTPPRRVRTSVFDAPPRTIHGALSGVPATHASRTSHLRCPARAACHSSCLAPTAPPAAAAPRSRAA